jgi:hypothetical protein
VSQHFGTKNESVQDRLALFSVFTPFAEPRQDDYQIFRCVSRAQLPVLDVRSHSDAHALPVVPCARLANEVCLLCCGCGCAGCATLIHCRWTYVDYAYSTGSRELAQAVWRDGAFSPLDRINDEASYEAYVRSVVRWRVASYNRRVAAREKRITWLKPQQHVPTGEAPIPDEQVERIIRKP